MYFFVYKYIKPYLDNKLINLWDEIIKYKNTIDKGPVKKFMDMQELWLTNDINRVSSMDTLYYKDKEAWTLVDPKSKTKEGRANHIRITNIVSKLFKKINKGKWKKDRLSAAWYYSKRGQIGNILDYTRDKKREKRILLLRKNKTPYWAKLDSPMAKKYMTQNLNKTRRRRSRKKKLTKKKSTKIANL